ncbi:MAG: PCMD domain-containing protein [Muribaculaceae bacterium]|nr:PCMD domain-containing protein [Muribaculaceae bacterium]
MNYISKTVTVFICAIGLLCTSCFKEEPLNAECDIEAVEVTVSQPEQFFFQVTDAMRTVISTDSIITFNVRGHADVSALAPRFRLTPGATVTPESGSVQDFTDGPVLYTVTSQDGKWHRRYWISFVPVKVTVNDTLKIDFEHFELDPKYKNYYVWQQPEEDGTLSPLWATGNGGFWLAKRSATADQYPTVPETNGLDGACLRLTTRDTGVMGMSMSKPIASGNFYMGEFDLTVAAKAPLKATRFGKPFDKKPIKFTGYYKYHPGPTFIDKNKKPVEGRTDCGSAYAVLYRNHDAQGNEVMLFGDDVQTNPNIVAIAKVPDIHPTNSWTAWEVEFNYLKDLDPQVLADKGYSLTVVFASSVDGDMFEGAIDSEMLVDKVRIICSREE